MHTSLHIGVSMSLWCQGDNGINTLWKRWYSLIQNGLHSCTITHLVHQKMAMISQVTATPSKQFTKKAHTTLYWNVLTTWSPVQESNVESSRSMQSVLARWHQTPFRSPLHKVQWWIGVIWQYSLYGTHDEMKRVQFCYEWLHLCPGQCSVTTVWAVCHVHVWRTADTLIITGCECSI